MFLPEIDSRFRYTLLALAPELPLFCCALLAQTKEPITVPANSQIEDSIYPCIWRLKHIYSITKHTNDNIQMHKHTQTIHMQEKLLFYSSEYLITVCTKAQTLTESRLSLFSPILPPIQQYYSRCLIGCTIHLLLPESSSLTTSTRRFL
jgi:hypothetical protein